MCSLHNISVKMVQRWSKLLLADKTKWAIFSIETNAVMGLQREHYSYLETMKKSRSKRSDKSNGTPKAVEAHGKNMTKGSER